MSTKSKREQAQAQEAARQKNLERAQQQQTVASQKLSSAQSAAKTKTAQTIFNKALSGLPSSYNKNTDVAKGMAAMSARYGLQGAVLNAYTGSNVGYNISEQTKAEQAALDEANQLVSGYSTPISIPEEDKESDKATRNAFALLKSVFAQYGLEELGDTLELLMKEGYEPEEASLALKTDPRYNKPYITRFKGNELRRAAGLNVLSEAEYLALEDDYTRTLKSYGLENYFGTTRTNKQAAIADVIGADVSALEFTERVSTAVDRVKMADPATKSAFQQFYGIGEADLVQYFLDPKKALVNLKEKATAAEIGGAAIGQGLPATTTSAEDLARFGISRQQAQAGYATIAEELPTATKLGQIYSQEGITYGQTEAEQATFKGLASAKRKKEQLKAREEAAFQGSSGVAPAGLKTTYLRQSSSAGYF